MNNPAPSALPDELRDSLLQHQGFIRRIALALSRDSHEADDLVQDTWLRALTREPHTDRSLGPWLAASARSLARNGRRAARRRRVHESGAADTREAAADAVEQLALRQEVVAAVLTLDEPFRSTVVMVYERGLTPAEIADVEGVAAATVRSRLFRAHEKLRGKLADSKVDRKRLASLAVLPGAGRSAAGAALPAKAVAGSTLLVGAGAMLLAAAGSTPPPVKRGTPELSVTRASGDLAGAAMKEAELVVPPVSHGRADAAPQDPRAKTPHDHPYWVAVRAARRGVERYVHPAEADAIWKALEGQSMPAGALPAEVGLRESFASFEKALGYPVHVSADALEESDPSEFGLEWIVPSERLSLETSLSLIIAGSGFGDISWEVTGAGIQVDTVEGLGEHVTSFEYGLADLLLQPGEFFDGGRVPHPIYAAAMSASDLATLAVDMGFGAVRRDQPNEPGADDTSMTLRMPPRDHVKIQAYLDAIRCFRQSLPEDGPCGATLQFPPLDENDARAMDELRRCGGWEALEPQDGETLERRLRAFAASAKVGVLWTSAARAEGVDFSELGFDVAFGSLLVRGSNESFGIGKAEMWFDLRTVLTGGEVTGEAAARHRLLRDSEARGEPLMLTPDSLENFIRDHLGGDSWENDPRLAMRVTEDDCLAIRQSLVVLDEVAGLVAALSETD